MFLCEQYSTKAFAAANLYCIVVRRARSQSQVSPLTFPVSRRHHFVKLGHFDETSLSSLANGREKAAEKGCPRDE
jgi:hypothetical protein